MSRKSRFLQACRLEQVDCTPVWFMRQAGRYMPEYRAVREKHGLLDMFKSPDIAAEITLQPVRAFEVDAAILFADILLPLEPMGFRLRFVEGEGPVIDNPVRSLADAQQVQVAAAGDSLGYVLKAVTKVRSTIDGQVPLIGFAGAPFTLAGYVVEGGGSRSFLETKRLMYGDRPAWNVLMTKIADTLAGYVAAQVSAGAQVIQLFDSWVGCLSPADYREFVLPHTRRVLDAVRAAGVPSIHFGTGTADLLPWMRRAGGDILGLDWRSDLDVGWERIGPGAGVQGNLDPVTLLGPWPIVQERAREILDRAANRPGHIFNLGHGILPPTPVATVRALTEFVHEYSRRLAAPTR